ncbi:MAG: hypothetical protein JW902_02115 [Syntrophaceae bacterium]|nr:hypothetical protein [Syntrophaceae bacterium]
MDMAGTVSVTRALAATINVNNASLSNAKLKAPKIIPIIIVSKREIDFGTISVGQEKEENFTIKNIGSDSLSWTILPPEDWFPLDQNELEGTSAGNDELVTLRINVIKNKDEQPEAALSDNIPVELTLENRSRRLTCVKDLPAGDYRDMIRIETRAGIKKTIFIKFNIVPEPENISLDVRPHRIDFGILKNDVPVTKRIRLTNKSNENIRWHTVLPMEGASTAVATRDRYLSFGNDDLSGKGFYATPARLEKRLQLSGLWQEYQGFPEISGKSILNLDFYGNAIVLFVNKRAGTGKFIAYVDNNLIKSVEFTEEDEEDVFYEIPLAGNMSETQHILTLALSGKGIVVEGAQIGRQDVHKGNRNWITVFPESGFTSKETDYINITLTPTLAVPGVYTHILRIASNKGNVDLPISYEITSELPAQGIDIYRYSKGDNYLYVSDLPTEEMRLTSKAFIKQGLAFQLFQPGTTGTVPFHRWYNPNTISQYYSYEYNKGNSLLGYIYEGAIGNIATSRLSNTRELYRWYNPKTKQYFYTADVKAEGMNKKGYLFDGIAGYVK